VDVRAQAPNDWFLTMDDVTYWPKSEETITLSRLLHPCRVTAAARGSKSQPEAESASRGQPRRDVQGPVGLKVVAGTHDEKFWSAAQLGE